MKMHITDGLRVGGGFSSFKKGVRLGRMSALRARVAAFGPVASLSLHSTPAPVAKNTYHLICATFCGFTVGIILVFWWIFQLE